MVKRRKQGQQERTIVFDVASRHDYLTGFRKRKMERRKVAVREQMERERKEKIDSKWDFREDVKRKYKEFLMAERRIDRICNIREEQKRRALRDEVSDQSALDDKPAVTVCFEVEDDDPFGGCEVTTSEGVTSLDRASADSEGQLAKLPTETTLSNKRPRGCRGGASKTDIFDGAGSTLLTYQEEGQITEEEQERKRKRRLALKKEEERRRDVQAKKLVKRMLDGTGKKTGRKKKLAGKKSSRKKVGAKMRRKRKG
eukprot:CAMPEP_0170618386 /NCGR_PEP_ID=MMETSP0224-20130122/26932_1 /TAXON_ID=285029 /ORGANISM="Togula jolla, Strain CCCM 725" /LENGTH=255 /DNA_ID=CAMNT_0010944359 /DNA_START=54 /DNA_END=821 /DNA_ORIENTATION=-